MQFIAVISAVLCQCNSVRTRNASSLTRASKMECFCWDLALVSRHTEEGDRSDVARPTSHTPRLKTHRKALLLTLVTLLGKSGKTGLQA